VTLNIFCRFSLVVRDSVLFSLPIGQKVRGVFQGPFFFFPPLFFLDCISTLRRCPVCPSFLRIRTFLSWRKCGVGRFFLVLFSPPTLTSPALLSNHFFSFFVTVLVFSFSHAPRVSHKRTQCLRACFFFTRMGISSPTDPHFLPALLCPPNELSKPAIFVCPPS